MSFSRAFVISLVVSAAGTTSVPAQTLQAGGRLTLSAAVDAALEANPEVRRAREQVGELDQRIRAVRADALPTVDLTGALQQARDPGLRNSPFFSRLAEADSPLPPDALDAFTFGTYFYRFDVEQPVYQFGRVRHALEAARQERDGVHVDVRSIENQIAFDTARAYYDVLLTRARREVLDAERSSRARQLEQARDLLDLGEATQLAFLQAQVALANLRPDVLAADNAIGLALARLNEVLGRAPDAPFEAAETLAAAPAPVQLPGGGRLLQLALANRPELQRYRHSRSVLEAAEGVARADLRPDIAARATLGINSYRIDNLARPSLHDWTVRLNVRWTLFDGHRTRSMIGQYRSQRRQSELEEEAFRARLMHDLERVTGDWRQATETIEVAALAVDQAQEARRVAEDLYSLGAATFLNVLDAERALRQAELSRLQGVHAARLALAELKTLVGFRPDAPDAVIAAGALPGSAPGVRSFAQP